MFYQVLSSFSTNKNCTSGKCIDNGKIVLNRFISIFPWTYIIFIIVKSTQSTSGNSSIHLFFIPLLKHKEFSDFPHITIYIKSYVLHFMYITTNIYHFYFRLLLFEKNIHKNRTMLCPQMLHSFEYNEKFSAFFCFPYMNYVMYNLQMVYKIKISLNHKSIINHNTKLSFILEFVYNNNKKLLIRRGKTLQINQNWICKKRIFHFCYLRIFIAQVSFVNISCSLTAIGMNLSLFCYLLHLAPQGIHKQLLNLSNSIQRQSLHHKFYEDNSVGSSQGTVWLRRRLIDCERLIHIHK